jgi:hypothetical protein
MLAEPAGISLNKYGKSQLIMSFLSKRGPLVGTNCSAAHGYSLGGLLCAEKHEFRNPMQEVDSTTTNLRHENKM